MTLHWPQVVLLVLVLLHAALVTLFDWLLPRRRQLPWYVGIYAFYGWLLWQGGFFGGCG